MWTYLRACRTLGVRALDREFAGRLEYGAYEYVAYSVTEGVEGEVRIIFCSSCCILRIVDYEEYLNFQNESSRKRV